MAGCSLKKYISYRKRKSWGILLWVYPTLSWRVYLFKQNWYFSAFPPRFDGFDSLGDVSKDNIKASFRLLGLKYGTFSPKRNMSYFLKNKTLTHLLKILFYALTSRIKWIWLIDTFSKVEMEEVQSIFWKWNLGPQLLSKHSDSKVSIKFFPD